MQGMELVQSLVKAEQWVTVDKSKYSVVLEKSFAFGKTQLRYRLYVQLVVAVKSNITRVQLYGQRTTRTKPETLIGSWKTYSGAYKGVSSAIEKHRLKFCKLFPR